MTVSARAYMLAAACAFSVVGAQSARADEIEDESSRASYASVAVQNRLHQASHEVTAQIGLLPLDAFTKGLTLGGSYTLHLSDQIGWEVINGFYSLKMNTGLRAQLMNFDLAPTPFEVVDYMLTTNLLFSPIYWKGAWLNDSLVYGEIFGVIGGGFAQFTRSSRIAADAGLGVRVYFDQTFSLRFDIRYMGFISTTFSQGFSVHSELWTSLGLSVSL